VSGQGAIIELYTPSDAVVGANDFHIINRTAGLLRFSTNNAERAHISATGSIVLGASALATTATAGYVYIPGVAGTPTGVPTTHAGRVALVYDTNNNRLYAYNGAWVSALFA
jgi:hypothetical protein